MTHTSQQTKIVYDPDGTLTVFAVPFPVFDAAEVECISVSDLDEEIYASGYTVSGIGTDNITVSFATPPAAGTKLVIRRHTRLVQESDYPTAGRFPAKTVEHDFDRIIAILQELDEHIVRAIKAPISGEIAPEELLADIFAARDTARAKAAQALACRDESCACADAAAQSETVAVTARTASIAAAVRAEAARDLAEDFAGQAAMSSIPFATAIIRGGVRIGAGLSITETDKLNVTVPVPAPSLPGDAGKVLAVGGTGPEWQAPASGLPLFALQPVPFSTIRTGYLSVCTDNGILTADAYREAYQQLVILQDAGDTNIVTMAAWQTEFTANGGKCGRFALDTTAQEFRIPCAPGLFWRGVMAGLNVGQYQSVLASGSALSSVAVDYQMKLYGAVTDAGTVQLAQLIAAMAGKLDTAVFNTIPFRNVWVSGEYTPAVGAVTSVNHGLTLPDPQNAIAEVWLKCVTAENGYAVGDIIRGFSVGWGSSSGSTPVAPPLILTATTIQTTTGATSSSPFGIINKTTGANVGSNSVANWRYIFRIVY